MSHVYKRQKVGLFATIGGVFDRGAFVLEILGDELDPDAVTRILGCVPTTSYRKGDETRSGSQYRRTGGWFSDSPKLTFSEIDDPSRLLEQWLATFPADRAVWDALQENLQVRVRLAAYVSRMNAELWLTPAVMKALVDRGLQLVVDPYLTFDADEAEAL